MGVSTVRAGLVFVVVLAAIVTLVGVGVGAPQADSRQSIVQSAASVDGYDELTLRIDLRPDGTARWHVEFRYRLDDQGARRAFERASDNVTNPPVGFVSRMQRAVTGLESRLGRSMRIENGSVVSRESVPAGRYGVVEYRFDWTNFARTDDGKLVVGDAIQGYTLNGSESLLVEWPTRLDRQSVEPAPDFNQSNAVRWVGPITFRTEDPTITLASARSSSAGGVPLFALVGLVGMVVAGAVLYIRSNRSGSDEETTAGEPTAAATGDAPEELLTDEERVVQLLQREGGRMKQQDLLAAVEWSRTKTSDVVNEMHEAEQIEVYRLGRENVLALPGEIDV